MTCATCQSRLLSSGICPQCLLQPNENDTFAGLKLFEPIGEGGMGTVYRALHVQLNRMVAVKVLSPKFAQNPELKQRFTHEARALAKLSHPNVVSVFDAGVEDGEAYLVMEYLEGGSLAERLPLSAAEAVQAALSVCEALQAVHDAGLLHRDIKPANILLGKNGEVKLSDFGIARSAETQGLTQQGLALGTSGFVAPEVLQGEAPSVQSDIYALGATLRQLLTNEAPVGECPPLPGGLEAIVRRAMASSKNARYGTARECALALREVVLEEAFALPAEEKVWERATALSMTLAFAANAWAYLLCLTPRLLSSTESLPLAVSGVSTLADGRIYSRFRFETAWVFAGAGFFCAALAAVGALRVHWRKVGLLTSRPSGTLPFVHWTFGLGALSLCLFWLHRQFFPQASYTPLLGGALLLSNVYVASMARLEAWRWGRRLRKEPLWLLGVAMGLVAPVVNGLQWIFRGPGP